VGLLWIVQRMPFQRSASGTSAPLVPADPTAVQAVAEVHDTPVRLLFWAPGGGGVAWVAHLAPSQRSARLTLTPLPPSKDPTAVQAVADGQETAERLLFWTPVGLGVARTAQPERSQCSAKVTSRPLGLCQEPVAAHAVVDGQDTARRLLLCAPDGLGVVSAAQLVPFQRSAKAIEARPLPCRPTAVQLDLEAHDTPARTLSPALVGLGEV
jgi:hypothetical protein